MCELRPRSIPRPSIEKLLSSLRFQQRLDRTIPHQFDETRLRSILDPKRTDGFDLGDDGARYVRTIQADRHKAQERIETFYGMIGPGKLVQISVKHRFAEGERRFCRG